MKTAVFMALAFTYAVQINPIDDSELYVADLGGADLGVSVYCGKATNGRAHLEIRSNGTLLRTPFSNHPTMIRFDDDEAARVYARWDRKRVVVDDYQAISLIERLGSAERMTVMLYDIGNEAFVIRIPLEPDKSAIERVIESCAAR